MKRFIILFSSLLVFVSLLLFNASEQRANAQALLRTADFYCDKENTTVTCFEYVDFVEDPDVVFKVPVIIAVMGVRIPIAN